MERLPNSFRERNRTTRHFRELYDRLPVRIQKLTRKACHLFGHQPDHPSFRRHVLKQTRTGQHQAESISISITMQYRAIYVVVDNLNVWYWIGTHAQYDRFIG
jgi:hypothetical protein